MSPLSIKAAMVSRAAHQAVGQKRKYTNEPYWKHPEAVADMVRKVDGASEQMVAAAYLHDVLEDTQMTVLDLKELFGETVASYVHGLTDQFTDPGLGNRAHRKALERDRLAAISPNAQTIKYADLIDNTCSIVGRDPGFASVYLVEKRRLLEVMDKGDRVLYRMALDLLETGTEKVNQFMAEHRANTYKVSINGRHKKTVFSEKDAWAVIGQASFDSLYSVLDADNNTRPEFVPY